MFTRDESLANTDLLLVKYAWLRLEQSGLQIEQWKSERTYISVNLGMLQVETSCVTPWNCRSGPFDRLIPDTCLGMRLRS